MTLTDMDGSGSDMEQDDDGSDAGTAPAAGQHGALGAQGHGAEPHTPGRSRGRLQGSGAGAVADPLSTPRAKSGGASRRMVGGALDGGSQGGSGNEQELENVDDDDDDMMMMSASPASALRSGTGRQAAPPAGPHASASAAAKAQGAGAAQLVQPQAAAWVPCGLARAAHNTVSVVVRPNSSEASSSSTTTTAKQTTAGACREVRLLLPLAVTSSLAAAALEVVRACAPAHLYTAFLRRFYAHVPPATDRPHGEWAAFDAVLLSWAVDPAGFAAAASSPQAAAGASPALLPLAPGEEGAVPPAADAGVAAPSSPVATFPTSLGPDVKVQQAAAEAAASGLGGRDLPPTPFSTPLHTRRFAAMSLTSPTPAPAPAPILGANMQMGGGGGAGGGGGSSGGAGGSAWQRLLAGETQSRLLGSRRRPAWMDPGAAAALAAAASEGKQSAGGGKAGAAGGGDGGTKSGESEEVRFPIVNLGALFSGVAAAADGTAKAGAAAAAAASAVLSPAAEPLLAVLYGLHSLYEECKLDVLGWPQLRPLGCTLAAVASLLGGGGGLHAYWEHYARDLGPPALAAAGAPEPPLATPPGLSLRPPTDLYRSVRLSNGAMNLQVLNVHASPTAMY